MTDAQQISLFGADPAENVPAPPAVRLTCWFGHDWLQPTWDGPHHCADCAAEVERARAEFDVAVAAGKWNARGYTPAEWRHAGFAHGLWATCPPFEVKCDGGLRMTDAEVTADDY